MFGISLTQSYQFKSTQFFPARRFGSLLKQTALLAAFVCCLALCSTPSQGQEPHPFGLHQSITEAQTIAARQQRPVLVMFTAEWSPASVQLRKHVLTDADAASLLSACFECVLIDVDDHPDVANELQIQHVPRRCTLDTNGNEVTRLECPSSTPLFIATVAHQIPQASTGTRIASQSSGLDNAVSVTATAPEISTDFSTAGTLLADGAATGPTTASESVSGIAAKVRGLSSFAMDESSFPKTAQEPPAQEKNLVTRFPATEQAVTAQTVTAQASSAANEQQRQSTGIQVADKPVPATSPWNPAPEPPATAEVMKPATVAATTTPWEPEVGHLHPETATPAAPNQIVSSPDTTPWTTPIPPEGATPSIEPKNSTPESRGIAQSPWLPAAAGAAVASSTRSHVTTQANQNQVANSQPATSQQTLAASGRSTEQASTEQASTEQASGEPRAEPQATNPLLAAIQKPFSVFSSLNETEEKAETDEKKQLVRKPVQAAYASQPVTAEKQEVTPPQKTMPLGLEGYCPVALMETGSWVEGQARWGARHRGRTYLF
ncbi:MAG: thioredoxin family protein, partial [Pirellulales bacterium]|nr:thioredoxin family protein [Pirellulales bacterium]